MPLYDRLRAIARNLWQRDNWSAELLAAFAAACYCLASLLLPDPHQPGFRFVAVLLTHVGVPYATAGLRLFGLTIGCGQIAALLLSQVGDTALWRWLRGLAMAGTAWLLTGITLGALLTRPEPAISFAATCLLADLYGLAKLLRGAK